MHYLYPYSALLNNTFQLITYISKHSARLFWSHFEHNLNVNNYKLHLHTYNSRQRHRHRQTSHRRNLWAREIDSQPHFLKTLVETFNQLPQQIKMNKNYHKYKTLVKHFLLQRFCYFIVNFIQIQLQYCMLYNCLCSFRSIRFCILINLFPILRLWLDN